MPHWLDSTSSLPVVERERERERGGGEGERDKGRDRTNQYLLLVSYLHGSYSRSGQVGLEVPEVHAGEVCANLHFKY